MSSATYCLCRLQKIFVPFPRAGNMHWEPSTCYHAQTAQPFTRSCCQPKPYVHKKYVALSMQTGSSQRIRITRRAHLTKSTCMMQNAVQAAHRTIQSAAIHAILQAAYGVRSQCRLARAKRAPVQASGVHLGHSEGWKPQKLGGCGWTMPSELDFKPRSP